ncbi:hypothetical protein, partial [Oceanithermus sp.]|uniref:hypothetical protein n=2 Tax=Oceanithermus sp. TaxID=2268145 RepID=UPI00257D3DDF
MKTLLRTSALLLALAAALAACSQAPLTVPLDDFSIQVDAVGNTAGQVIYPKNAAQFSKPVLNVKTIQLKGQVTVSYTAVQAPLTMTFYARTSDPKNAGCTDAGLAWICNASGETAISTGYTFADGETKSIALGDPNPDVLANGLNQGFLWIGAEVTSGAATGVTFDFTQMVAQVTVF